MGWRSLAPAKRRGFSLGYAGVQDVATSLKHGWKEIGLVQSSFFFFFKSSWLTYLFISFIFLAVLGLRFYARAFSSCGKRGPLFIAVCGPFTVAASLVGSTGSRRAASVVVAHGPSCSAACGILPDQGSNPCRLHWQADSQPLHHQGSPSEFIFVWRPMKRKEWKMIDFKKNQIDVVRVQA